MTSTQTGTDYVSIMNSFFTDSNGHDINGMASELGQMPVLGFVDNICSLWPPLICASQSSLVSVSSYMNLLSFTCTCPLAALPPLSLILVSTRWLLVFGCWSSLVVGRWSSLVVGLWSLVVVGRWSLVVGLWSLVFGLESLVVGHRSLVVHCSLVIGRPYICSCSLVLTPDTCGPMDQYPYLCKPIPCYCLAVTMYGCGD